MKTLLRSYLINLGALWTSSQLIPSLSISGGLKGLLVGALAFMAANLILVPILKIMLLPLNLITLGLFAWLSNVLALYVLVLVVPSFSLSPYQFAGLDFEGLIIPSVTLSTFQAAIVVSFIIGFIIHFINWLIK